MKFRSEVLKVTEPEVIEIIRAMPCNEDYITHKNNAMTSKFILTVIVDDKEQSGMKFRRDSEWDVSTPQQFEVVLSHIQREAQKMKDDITESVEKYKQNP